MRISFLGSRGLGWVLVLGLGVWGGFRLWVEGWVYVSGLYGLKP